MKSREKKMNKCVKAVITGVLSGVVVITSQLIIGAAILTQMKTIPDTAMGTIAMVFAALGALAGGYITVRISKCNGMLYGLLTGFIIFALIVIMGLCGGTESISIATVIKGVAMLLSGAIGGITAVNKKQRVKYK